MKTESYKQQQIHLPKEGKYIVANFNQETITVYQAYNKNIAYYAIKNQKFGGNHYSFNRMTWIKPNFMWMMYRSGWATKNNQERILAIQLKRSGFEALLESAVISSFKPELYQNIEEWKAALENSEVRLQWDPDHNPVGEKLTRKAIQIGIKGKTLRTFNDDWIIHIEDITDFVKSQHANAKMDFENLVVPFERVMTFNKNRKVIDQIGLDWNPWNIYIEFIVDNEDKFNILQQIFTELKADKSTNQLDCEDPKWKKYFSNKYWSIGKEDPEYYEWLVDAYSSGEYEFLSCDYAGEDTAKLICKTWSAPYGGFDPLRELITNFDFEIVDEWE